MKYFIYNITLIFIVGFFIYSAETKARINSEVNGDECKIVLIKYSGIDNFIHAQGNCENIYNMCTEDFCKVEELEGKDLSFKKENIGEL